jgi:hypothetical protein
MLTTEWGARRKQRSCIPTHFMLSMLMQPDRRDGVNVVMHHNFCSVVGTTSSYLVLSEKVSTCIGQGATSLMCIYMT